MNVLNNNNEIHHVVLETAALQPAVRVPLEAVSGVTNNLGLNRGVGLYTYT